MGDKTIQRRFSLENDFMNYKTNDLLYGFMRGLSTARPIYEKGKQEWQEYLPKKTFNKHKKLIAAICECTPRTIDRHIEKLFEAGLLDEGLEIVEKDGKEYEYACYWFPYDYDSNYKLVEQDVIKYLVNTRHTQAIRIYLYLLSKYQWKKNYVFTIQEIKESLGYAASTKTADSMIKDILASFSKEGMIKYEKFYDEVDIGGMNDYKVVPVERMKLKYVVSTSAELPKF